SDSFCACVIWPRRCTKLRICEANPPVDGGTEADAPGSPASGFVPCASAASGGFLLRLSRSASLMSTASYGNHDFDLVVGGQYGVRIRATRNDGAVALKSHALAGIAESLDKL